MRNKIKSTVNDLDSKYKTQTSEDIFSILEDLWNII